MSEEQEIILEEHIVENNLRKRVRELEAQVQESCNITLRLENERDQLKITQRKVIEDLSLSLGLTPHSGPGSINVVKKPRNRTLPKAHLRCVGKTKGKHQCKRSNKLKENVDKETGVDATKQVAIESIGANDVPSDMLYCKSHTFEKHGVAENALENIRNGDKANENEDEDSE